MCTGPQPKSYTETNGGASQVTLNELADEQSAATVASRAHQLFVQQQQQAAQAAAKELVEAQAAKELDAQLASRVETR